VAKEQITIKGDWAELFMCARSSWRAMVRKESPQTIPLDISSRSERVSASPERWRPRGRIPPKRAKFLVIAEWLVSKARAIALSDSPHFGLFCCRIPSSFSSWHFQHLIFSSKDKVLRRSVEPAARNGHCWKTVSWTREDFADVGLLFALSGAN
jgi:hypothetical protein